LPPNPPRLQVPKVAGRRAGQPLVAQRRVIRLKVAQRECLTAQS